MKKLINLLTTAGPLIKKLLWPNGKFSLDRAYVIIALFFITVISIALFGVDTVVSATELLAPLVEMIGSL